MPAYPSPRSLSQALHSRLRRFATENPGRSTQDLHQQFAYDRLLARLFSDPDADRWVLKGSNALLARYSGAGRHTRDVDVYRTGEDDAHEAEKTLRRAVRIDLDDFFRFSLGPALTIAGASRIPVEAILGVTQFARFPVDVVTGLKMTGKPELLDPPLPKIPGIVRVSYRVYPLPDHVADKVCALHEIHHRRQAPDMPSTRYRDLSDLAVIARASTIDAIQLTTAVRSEESRRGLTLPRSLNVPTDHGWRPGYAAVVRSLTGIIDDDLESATVTVGAFINPILEGTARGTWDRETLSWHQNPM